MFMEFLRIYILNLLLFTRIWNFLHCTSLLEGEAILLFVNGLCHPIRSLPSIENVLKQFVYLSPINSTYKLLVILLLELVLMNTFEYLSKLCGFFLDNRSSLTGRKREVNFLH